MARGDGARCMNSPTIFGNRYSHSEQPQLLSELYNAMHGHVRARMDEFSAKFVSARIVSVSYDGISTTDSVRFPAAFCLYYGQKLAANILPLAACLRDRIAETCSRRDISGRKVAFVRPQC